MKEQEKITQWHPAFYAGIQIELKDYAKDLVFENEHMLSNKPMQIDVLIIKKNTKEKIQKNIGQIFQKYNIIEYKSPTDYLSIDDFYKVYGYTCFYKADTGGANAIKTEELTIAFVCSHYPQKLIKHLREERKKKIKEQENGIYYIQDDLFLIQLIIVTQLSEEQNLWLRSLTNCLTEAKIAEKLIRAYEGHNHDTLYSSIMEVIVNANKEQFLEVKKMCNALKELMKDELEERERYGISKGISQGIS